MAVLALRVRRRKSCAWRLKRRRGETVLSSIEGSTDAEASESLRIKATVENAIRSYYDLARRQNRELSRKLVNAEKASNLNIHSE